MKGTVFLLFDFYLFCKSPLDSDTVLTFMVGHENEIEEEKMEEKIYIKQSIISNPRQYKRCFAKLPETPKEMLKVVQGLIIHGDLGKLYGVTFSKRQQNEELLRTIPQMLENLLRTNSQSIGIARKPSERLVGMCRDYSLLFVSFLRNQGIPARVRAGFANYFDSDMEYEDHWIAEYFNETQKEWIRVDTQLDQIQREYYGINFDTMNMNENCGFLLAGKAWLLCREGDKHQEDFGYNKNWKGWISVKGNLLHDFNCLLGLELMPWDLWTDLSTKKYSELTTSQLQVLDEIARLTCKKVIDREELEQMMNSLPSEYMSAIHSQLKLLNVTEKSETVEPDKLEEKYVIQKKAIQMRAKSEIEQNRESILLKGGRQNNLKNIDVIIPKNKLTVITGVSGSGKSSLAFDTIYAEGKRRYLDNMSSLTKMQEQVEKPDFDSLTGLTPTIAIEQKKGSKNPRSTVGTLTGITDQLRMLYTAIGKPHCPYCGVVLEREGKNKLVCPTCRTLFPKLTATMFNSNNHIGACHECNGLGFLYEVNEKAIFSREDLSVLDGASNYFGKLRGRKKTGNWMVGELFAIAQDRKINLDLPWKEQPESFKRAVLYGTGDKIYHYQYHSSGRNTEFSRPAIGAVEHIRRLFREAKTDDNAYSQYMKERVCPVCHGEQLCMEARYTTVLGYRLPELLNLPVNQLSKWCIGVQEGLTQEEREKAGETFKEIYQKTEYLKQVGLSYVTMIRTAPSLSGGELQRVRLSSQLGSDLVGLTYVLDEPSIGLHPRDHHLMITTMKQLRDKGNTVIVVEHDRDTMLNADYIVDVGPGAGIHGGSIVATGSVDEIKKNKKSLTGNYLSKVERENQKTSRKATGWMKISDCSGNNLKHITAKIPLHTICCITGASGSGKSTLIFETLVPALEEKLKKKPVQNKNYEAITGIEQIDGFVEMNQAPIGKTSRSTPATYIGVFDDIRELYASLPLSMERGYGESNFSFNSKDGQCLVCEGLGEVKIAFQYMADHYVTCNECGGKRFKEEILDVLYKGKSIADVLQMDISEAIELFDGIDTIVSKLKLMEDVGLSYLKLGQNTVTLSGGESQRLKLSKELGSKKKEHILYILDEPTTGLHFKDIERLQLIFERLVDAGNSLIIIEHNMDVARKADWIIDMGPFGGENGGQIMAEGTPHMIAQNKESVTGKWLFNGEDI